MQDGRASHSQSDLLALIGLQGGLGVLGIEAKVDEGFDRTVDEWRAHPSPGKEARLTKLCALFGFDPAQIGHLRYQLLHRTAAAVLEATRYRARHAAVIIQSWSPADDGFSDYLLFLQALGLREIGRRELSGVRHLEGVELRTAWSSEAG